MIVDAGGGTVDISSYAFVSVSPLSVEEVTSADCKSLPCCSSAIIPLNVIVPQAFCRARPASMFAPRLSLKVRRYFSVCETVCLHRAR